MNAPAITTEVRPLCMHEADNVALVANEGGLLGRTVFASEPTLVDCVPQGHKVAAADFGAGGEVNRYDVTIGRADKPIPKGSWVVTGPTVTNVNEFRAILIERAG